MTTSNCIATIMLAFGCFCLGVPVAQAEQFTRLVKVEPPKIIASAPEFASGGFGAGHLVDGNVKTEYSSQGKGTETFVEFDFGKPTPIAAMQHVDRKDPATISRSQLVLLDEQGQTLAQHEIAHPGNPGGTTQFILPAPVTARRARWQVTGLGTGGHSTVGGAELTFFAAGQADPAPTGTTVTVTSLPVVQRKDAATVQTLSVAVDYPYAETIDAELQVEGSPAMSLKLAFGSRAIEAAIPALIAEKKLQVVLQYAGKPVVQQQIAVKPVAPSLVYILAHSHVDIGYTELQPDVERKQMSNIAKGIALAKATADYPEGARYKWNVEVLWAVESYLRQSSPEKQQEFINAVRAGQVGLEGMYGNELTGLCRPEELIRLFSYATRLSERCGVPIDAAMISDVPGYTWGTVTAMAQAGIKYWSIGPNYCDRIGYTMVAWADKPFYWVGPNGRDKVLCWVPYNGYAISHLHRTPMDDQFVIDHMNRLGSTSYPYDISYVRWSGFGDNAVPDETLPGFVKGWNERYASPRLALATTAEVFRAFEQRYGDKLPKVSGDFTPYWEDGAASSARETAINRMSAERLVQAETLWAMLKPDAFPAERFQDAWRNVLLYDEHTWGAHNSITQPELDFVQTQWKIKQAFALDAETQSKQLLQEALVSAGQSDPSPQREQGSSTQPALPASQPASQPALAAIDVYNPSSWPRTDLVVLPADMTKDVRFGGEVKSQRLTTGELAFIAENVPPFAAKQYKFQSGKPEVVEVGNASTAEAVANTLHNELINIHVDEKTGAIAELRAKGIDRNLVDTEKVLLNDYFYVIADEAAHAGKPSNVKISVKERGPLVASLLVESDAPGCNKLAREIRLVAGMGRVEIINTLDKKRAEVRGGKPGDWARAARESKEGVHFGFSFSVPNGVMRMDLPFAVARPELDQILGACKNWFTVQRWVDVSNDDFGVTCATIDAPLIEVGSITAILLGSQRDPNAWINKLEPTQTFYSWVMNNHWHTNYRAYQDGPTTFRYVLQPHNRFAPQVAARFGMEASQPLIVAPANGEPKSAPRLIVDSPDVVVSALKPADEGKGLIVRLFRTAGAAAKVKLEWSDPKPISLWLSDTSEKPLKKLEDATVDVPATDVVTLRAMFE